MTPNAKSISDAFVAARLAARSLPSYPGILPASMAEAYAIQDHSIANWPDRVVGWKIGLVPDPFREAVGTDRLVGPIFAGTVHEPADPRGHAMPAFAGGFAAVEAEFIFKLARSVPADVPIDRDLVIAVAGALHVGVEIASSPFPGINDLGPICVVTDFGNNNGLIVGPEIVDWVSRDWSDLPASVEIDGVLVGEAPAAAIPGSPLGALEFILHLMRERGIALPAGSLISTGAVTGVHQAEIGSRSRVSFGAFGDIELELVPAVSGRTAPQSAVRAAP